MSDNDGEAKPCPSCGNVLLHCGMETERFPYGVGPEPTILTVEVLAFTCDKCGEKFTGEQAEAARAYAVELHKLVVFPQLVAALKAQHHAIDELFARMIELTSAGAVPTEVFYPSKSGHPWEALLAGRAAIYAAGGDLHG